MKCEGSSVVGGNTRDPFRFAGYADLHAAASTWQPVSCDGVIVAKIKRGNFFALIAASWRHACAIDNATPAFVTVKPNEDVFLRVDEHDIIGEPRILILSSVPPDLARKDIRWLPYIPAKILTSTVNPADPRAPEEPKFKTRQQNQ